MQHKCEADFERRLVARIKRECAGGDSKGGGTPAPAVAAAPPPPDLGPDTALAAQNEMTRDSQKRGAAATQLTGTDGALAPAVKTAALSGGAAKLLG